MCQAPSPHLQKLLFQLNAKAEAETAAIKNRLEAQNKVAAREQLLRIQLEISRKFTK